MGGLVSRYIYGKKDVDDYDEILEVTDKFEIGKIGLKMCRDVMIVYKKEETALTKMTFNKLGALIKEQKILLPKLRTS